MPRWASRSHDFVAAQEIPAGWQRIYYLAGMLCLRLRFRSWSQLQRQVVKLTMKMMP